jgi:hypothetical protein
MSVLCNIHIQHVNLAKKGPTFMAWKLVLNKKTLVAKFYQRRWHVLNLLWKNSIGRKIKDKSTHFSSFNLSPYFVCKMHLICQCFDKFKVCMPPPTSKMRNKRYAALNVWQPKKLKMIKYRRNISQQNHSIILSHRL